MQEEVGCPSPWLHRRRGLKDSAQVVSQHQWVTGDTALLTGRNYMNCHKVRISALPTRTRITRGRYEDRSYCSGRSLPETSSHILQICPGTHNVQIARHNYIGRNLRHQRFTVFIERHIPTTEGKAILSLSWKPWEWWLTPRLQVNTLILKELDGLRSRKTPAILTYKGRSNTTKGRVIFNTMQRFYPAGGSRAEDQQTIFSAVNRRDLAVIATRVPTDRVIAKRTFNRTIAVQFRV